MDIYIASTLSNAGRVKQLIKRLHALGYNITYDWTSHNNGEVYIDDDRPDLKRLVAERELSGVSRAHCLLIVMPGERGTHFEFGFAYALGKPIVMLLDRHEGRSPSFHYLDGVVRCHTEDDAITAVAGILSQSAETVSAEVSLG